MNNVFISRKIMIIMVKRKRKQYFNINFLVFSNRKIITVSVESNRYD